MKYLRWFILFIVGLSSVQSEAQDAHFSQFFASPLYINPALAGTFSANYRISAVYRDQWFSGIDSPFETFMLSSDLRFDLNGGIRKNPDVAAVGISFFSDNVSGFDLNTNSIALTGAYHKSLDDRTKHYIGVGFQFGIMQRSVSYENLFFQDQFNTLDGFTLSSGETLPPNNYANIDLSLGINYTRGIGKDGQLFLGAAMYHLNSPNYSYFQDSDNPDPSLIKENNIFPRITFNAIAEFTTSEIWGFSPRVILLSQGPHREYNIGNTFIYKFIKFKNRAIHFGGNLRVVDGVDNLRPEALVVLMALEYNNFILGASYDQGISDIGNSRLNLNSFEISVNYLGRYDNDTGFCTQF